MSRIEEITLQFVQRNQRKRGPTSSDELNDMFTELAADLTSFDTQWDGVLLPLTLTIPDGTVGGGDAVDAFTDGLDGKTLYVDALASSSVNPTYYKSASTRPYTLFEQLQLVYTSISSLQEDLENQISNLTQKAANISVLDSGNLLTSNNVEDALAEIKAIIDATDGVDSDAIHDNISGEISAVTVKATPISADILLIEDSSASFAKKKVTVGTIKVLADYISIHLSAANTAAPTTAHRPFDTTTNLGTTTTKSDSGTITFSAVTGRFTVPTTGAYEISVTAMLLQAAAGLLDGFKLVKNAGGSPVTVWDGDCFISNVTDPEANSFSVIVNLAASDTIEFEVDANGGNTIDAQKGTTMSVKRIG